MDKKTNVYVHVHVNIYVYIDVALITSWEIVQ